jgi:four helix bundle protein
MQTNKSPNLVVNLSFEFALNIIKYSAQLEAQKKYIIANQLLRSGTSIGANIREAQNAESKQDFIHKLKIAAKEADETEYWLLLCNASNYPDCCEMITDVNLLIKVLSKIIATTKNSIGNSKK